jgi:hypothetical protein
MAVSLDTLALGSGQRSKRRFLTVAKSNPQSEIDHSIPKHLGKVLMQIAARLLVRAGLSFRLV